MALRVDYLEPSTSGCNSKKSKENLHVPHTLYDPVQLRQYSVLNFLGKGAYGRCYEMKELTQLPHDNTTNVALKVISKSTLRDFAHIEKIRKEVAIHSSLNHDNIIKLLSFFEDSMNIYMVLELGVYGTLLNSIQSSMTGHLSELVARCYMRQIVDAVLYIHEVAGILHRDLKPGNILLGHKSRVRYPITEKCCMMVQNTTYDIRRRFQLLLQVKLADFGLAVKISDLPKVSHALSGTPNYLSPEVLDNYGHSKESEAWALGCIFYCMVVGKPPFETEDLEGTYARIRSCSYVIPTHARISERACSLIRRLLDRDVRRRMKVTEIMQCDYFSNGNSISTSNPLGSPSSIHNNGTTTPEGYQAGILSRDSGLECENMRSPDPGGPLLLLNLFMCGVINGNKLLILLLSVTNESSTIIKENIIMVNKWVDYTNKYGFGCILSDYTECMLFLDGSSYAHRSQIYAIYSIHFESIHDQSVVSLKFASPYNKECIQMVLDPLERHSTIYRWSSVDDIQDLNVIRKMKIAALLRCMHRELQSATSFIAITSQINHLVYQKRGNGVLVMVLSDGTTQINLLETHEKLVLRMDENDEISVVVVNSKHEMRSCRMCAKAPIPSSIENRRIYDLITEARFRLFDHCTGPYYVTEC
ncbi:unnamed protein product [Anisakis simplex]|uniref:Inactive serine/threonine-protein kinase PLK5 (inferred by orthology to a human protein) n=1 Tax=Anisakis simplex TaxID=6269 RepID=A0A0M3JYQ1_ANISI|nr:unnamed protein product [Anisakis simplex]